ncbi:MAG: hypothetical protein CML46_03340 [Rhodobacteraceae bacterium]|nr:hypothetical protein [Paracoccaceae bacterium]MBR25976.1 hypothetical protein [Paracoccaceae bacterium]|tara:strand:- start:565 stop:1794 length:1230 start_codon:yes stop_codon:yes gene_type:complete
MLDSFHHWPVRALGELVSFRNGLNFTQAANGERVKIVGVGDFLDREEIKDIAALTEGCVAGEVREEETLNDGDLLFVRSNGNKALVGRCALVRPGSSKVCFSGFTIRARVTVRDVDAFYLVKLARSEVMLRELHRLGSGSSINNLSQDILSEVRLPFPPLPEQRRIAGILRTWDEAIDAASRLIDAKRRRLDGVAARLFASTRAIGGGRRPEGWTRMTFGDAFAERKTRNPGLLDTDVVTVGKYAIRKQSEHFKRSVASKDLSPYWVISPGDFVYDPMSAYYGALGRFDGASDGVVSPAYRVIRLAKGLDSDFMAELLKQHHVRFQLDALSSQGNKEGKRRSLQRSAFDSVEFFAPGQNAQREMAGKVALFRADLAASETHLDALKRQKRGLMQKLLTGDWRVPAEPAG